MMFGLGGRFTYRECAGCGALVLLDPPADMAPYYPDGYYSYHPRRPRLGGLDRWLKCRRARAWLGGHDPLGRLLLLWFGPTPQLRWLRELGIGFDDPILDVGCGGGELLRELHRDGFRDLTGIDPYLPADEDPAPGLRLRRWTLADAEPGRYALVMLHHALEHLPDQDTVFARLRRILRPGGRLLVRIPMADSEAWRRYGTDWVQLDAPRHLVLHTRSSLELVAGRSGFRIDRVTWDSTAFQFWGSEQYRRGIPLRDRRSHAVDPRRSPFTRAQIALYEQMANELNRRGAGDQAVFFLSLDGGPD